MNNTNDKGRLGGLTPLWRGAKLGRIAKAILIDSATASPVFLLDELDKASSDGGEHVLDVLLSALEEENARDFLDEYLNVPIRADHANWLCSANDLRAISAPLLDRLLVIEIAAPTPEQSRGIVESVAADLIGRKAGGAISAITEAAVAALVGMNARRVSRIVDLAIAFAICRRSGVVGLEDVAPRCRLGRRSPRFEVDRLLLTRGRSRA